MQPQWSDLARLVNEEKREVYLRSSTNHKYKVLGVVNNCTITSVCSEFENWETMSSDVWNHIQELIREGYSIEPLEEPKSERWVPKIGEKYFTVFDNGFVGTSVWDADNTDLFRLSVGNVHRTEKEAIEYRERWVKLMGQV